MSDESEFVPFPPTIAVEVISPHDRFSEVEEKADLWLISGSEVVIPADPESLRLHILTGPKNVLVVSDTDTTDLSAHLPDCRIAVRELFD